MDKRNAPTEMDASSFTSGSGWVLSSDLPLPELQDAIRALHREEYAKVADHYDANDLLSRKVPYAEMMNHGERCRVDWEQFVQVRDDVRPVEHRTGPTKTEIILDFARNNVGRVVSIKSLAQAGDCSESTVHKVISDYRQFFKKGMFSGTYELLDPDAERERDLKRHAAPADSSPPAPAA